MWTAAAATPGHLRHRTTSDRNSNSACSIFGDLIRGCVRSLAARRGIAPSLAVLRAREFAGVIFVCAFAWWGQLGESLVSNNPYRFGSCHSFVQRVGPRGLRRAFALEREPFGRGQRQFRIGELRACGGRRNADERELHYPRAEQLLDVWDDQRRFEHLGVCGYWRPSGWQRIRNHAQRHWHRRYDHVRRKREL